jgi:hypothetical protein
MLLSDLEISFSILTLARVGNRLDIALERSLVTSINVPVQILHNFELLPLN